MLAWATEPMYAEELIGTRLADLDTVGACSRIVVMSKN